MNPYRLPDTDLEALLQDDCPCGDATTFTLGIGERPGRLVFRARQPMVVCGSEEAARMGELRGLLVDGTVRGSGSHLDKDEIILSLRGNAGALHSVWKTAQTLMEYLSGIASATAAIVDAARRGHSEAAVACTRKNFPGTKAAAMKSVLCAGAAPHRLGLSETLLVFAEHRVFLDEQPATTLARLRRTWPERRVVVEVGNEDEAMRWASAGADVLQLEKMSPEQVAELSSRIQASTFRPVIAAAGGVNAGNAEAYVRAGARLLVSSAPYFSPPRDVAVRLDAL
jgi:molybdenum transport protein